MKVTTIRVCGGVKRSSDFQSADCSFEVEVQLDPTDNAKTVLRDVYRSMMKAAHEEAQIAITEAVRIKRDVEGI